MLTRFLASRGNVKLATTDEEREAIYRFRYTVYVEEKKWNVGGVDHERRVVRSDDDDAPFARHFYSGTPDSISGAARALIWERGRVPEVYAHEYSMDLFPNLDELKCSAIERLCIADNLRGKVLLPAMASFCFDLLAGEDVDLCFNLCRPTLLKYYRKLGARPFGGRLYPMDLGLAIPMVAVLSDHDYFRKVKAVTAPNVRKHFGPGKRPVLEQSPFAHLFAADARQVLAESGDVLREMTDRMAGGTLAAPRWFSELSPKVLKLLADSGFLMNVDEGQLVVAEGVGERELYLLVEGSAKVVKHDATVGIIPAGGIFGEVAFFRESGVRTASVIALEKSRILVIRYRFLEELRKKDPEAAWAILFDLGRLLADRLQSTTAARN